MKYKHIVIPAIVAFLFVSCQKDETPEPAKERYLDQVFGQVQVQTVTYSSVSNFEMDIYTPVGDDLSERPLVVLAHGGGFFTGTKNNPLMVDMARDFAKRGYVAASFNYTLAAGFTDVLDSANALNLVLNSVGDARAAIRFFRKNVKEMGNQYGINTNNIFAGGNSAGAVLASHLAIFDANDNLSPHLAAGIQANGGFEGNRGNPGYSSSVKGAINLAGAVKTITLIDADDAPVISFHGTDDDIVPYNCGDVFTGVTGGLDVIDVCGSNSMHNASLAAGHSSQLFSYPGAMHVPWNDPDTGAGNALFEEIRIDIISFLFQNIN